MTRFRSIQSGRGRPPMVLLPNGIMRRPLSSHVLSADQTLAQNLARQWNYANEAFNFNIGSNGYAATGYGGNAAGFNTVCAWKTFTNPVYIMPTNTPRVPVLMVNEEVPISSEQLAAEETLRSNVGLNAGIQANFLSVPMPDLTKVLYGRLPSLGTDSQLIVICGNEMWEMHRAAQFVHESEQTDCMGVKRPIKAGDWKFGFGGYHDRSTWNGIGTEAGWVSGSALCAAGGIITLQDVIDVLRGGSINHALGAYAIVRRNEEVRPALRHDTGSLSAALATWKNGKGETVANPAYTEPGIRKIGEATQLGYRDSVPEGLLVGLPAGAHPTDYGCNKELRPLEYAFCQALITYGCVVQDGGGACGFYIEDYHTLGSPYCYTQGINPYAGYNVPGSQDQAYMQGVVNAPVPARWKDDSLPLFTEQFESTNSIVYNLLRHCGGDLQQYEPFSS